MNPKYIGILLAVTGNMFISVSVTVQKRAHIIIKQMEEPVPYVKLPLWWVGMLLMVVGEVGNFAAYGFAPAVVVAPLGAVSVVFNALLAARFLGEPLRRRNVIGTGFALLGGLGIVRSVDSNDFNLTVEEFLDDVTEPLFIAFLCAILGLTAFLVLRVERDYGERYVFVYILICSLIGCITVMSCKGLSTFIRLTAEGDNQFSSPLAWFLIVVVGSTTFYQVKYLQKSMQTFGASEVVPVYYVLFSLSSVLGGVILFKEFAGIQPTQFLLFIAGCLLTFYGVYLITSDSELRRVDGDESGEDLDDTAPFMNRKSRNSVHLEDVGSTEFRILAFGNASYLLASMRSIVGEMYYLFRDGPLRAEEPALHT